MTTPKKKKSRAKRDKGRAHKRLTAPAIDSCPKCHKPKQPHRVCPHCGYYREDVAISVGD